MSAAASSGAARGSQIPWGAIRLAVVVLGGLLVLQSSDEVDLPKLIYLAIAAAAFGGALYSVLASRARIPQRYVSLLLLNAGLFALLGLSFVVAAFNRTPAIDWFRDALGYGLFAAVPILSFDAAASSTRRFLTVFLVVVGVLGSLSWAVEWLDRREIAELPLDRLLLPASHLAIALYVFALAVAITRRNMPYAWSCAAGLVLGVFLATGTRSSLLLLAAPLAMVIAFRQRSIAHTLRVVGLHLITALVVFVGADLLLQPPAVAPTPTAEGSPAAEAPDAVDRIESIEELATNPGGDPSVKERVAQYEAAWGLFLLSPLIGVGPGHAIEWIDVSGLPRDDFTADTPLVLLAKFGLFGAVLVGLLAVAYVRVSSAIVKRDGWTAGTLALFAFGVYSILSLPLGMPIEDKSFSFALAVLIALALLEQSPGVGVSDTIGRAAVEAPAPAE